MMAAAAIKKCVRMYLVIAPVVRVVAAAPVAERSDARLVAQRMLDGLQALPGARRRAARARCAAITLDRYGHLMPGNEAEAATRLDAPRQRQEPQAS